MAFDDENDIELKRLKVTCGQSDCDHNLHCFRQTKKMAKQSKAGCCVKCGAKLIDWQRMHQRRLADVSHTFESLKYEWIRHRFWHLEFDRRAMNYAMRKGRIQLNEAAEHRLRTALQPNNPYDGRQTKFEGNPIYYAQHAVACCCRKCIEVWHGIPRNRPLTEEETQYFKSLIILFFDERLPDLPEAGRKVPPIRHTRTPV